MNTPHHVLFKTPPNYKKLKTFGCLCFPWLKPYTNHKLQPRSEPCLFLGYSLTQSAYICFNFKTNKFHHSRHVQFLEDIFPYYPSSTNSFPISHSPSSSQQPPSTPHYESPPLTSVIPIPNPTITDLPQRPHSPTIASSDSPPNSLTQNATSSPTQPVSPPSPTPHPSPVHVSSSSQPLAADSPS